KMAVRFACGKCGKKLQAAEKLAGKQVKCPDCGSKTKVPARAKEKAGVVAGGPDPGFEIVEETPATKEVHNKPEKGKKALRECPECEEMIPEKAVICRFCGAKFDLATKEAKMRQNDEIAKKKRRSGGNGVVVAI